MSDIAQNIISLKKELPGNVRLVAVSKTKSVSDILEAYNVGQKIFGENRVQELLSKKDMLPSDIEWHLIGHLQTNKVKYIVPFISMVQSVDTFRLLNAINAEASKSGKVVNCLLQFFIATEETKFGFSLDEAEAMISSPGFNELRNVRVCGVMGMATFTDDTILVRSEFRSLASVFKVLKTRYFSNNESFKIISMGMSGDYMIAVEEGSTMVRIGSIIFGERKG